MTNFVAKHKRTTLERAEKLISKLYFTDVNLYGKIYEGIEDVDNIEHYEASDRIKFHVAKDANYTPVKIGNQFGPLWATHWFKLTFYTSKFEFSNDETMYLEWDSQSEAMIWSEDGKPLQSFSDDGRRKRFHIKNKLSKQVWFVEMACNGLFGGGKDSMIGPPDPDKKYTLAQCRIVSINQSVYDLLIDFQLLIDIVKELGESTRSYQALYSMNRMVNCIDINSKDSYLEAKEIATSFFNQSSNDQTVHTIHAIANCHIDSAWLWPYSETIRKCARSFSSTIRLMEKFENFKFACSQGQQFQWVKENYPSLYEDIKKFVKLKRFIPVGGTWCEMDGNLPSGESIIRQFLYGQRFFRKEFGVTCKEFWLPDTFGYSGQLPQLMRIGCMTRFVTQKMSWNIYNKFPHNTFHWIGIDGSKVLCHFPPGDSYTMECKIEEIIKTEKNFKDKGRSDRSMFLYGHGDGGHGPTPEMLTILNRLQTTVGLPKIVHSTPEEFFDIIEKKEMNNLCEWVGELYLEMHNGTYTTQALTKKNNRMCEYYLRDAEFLLTLAWLNGKMSYPHSEMERIWKLLLLNQFHDVLPGSSIKIVYEDATKYYNDIRNSSSNLINVSINKLFDSKSNTKKHLIINSLGWTRHTVICLPSLTQHAIQKDINSRNELVFVEIPGFHVSTIDTLITSISRPVEKENNVSVSKENELFILQNSKLIAKIDNKGRIVSLKLHDCKKDFILSKPANQFVIFDDIPLYWDAWDVMDYHLETIKTIDDILECVKINENGPIRASVLFKLKISEISYLEQTISLDMNAVVLKFDTKVTWNENRKFLKVEFPLNVHSEYVTYETQYGYLRRPSHRNTSWDSAKYEVCGHKWADMSEFDFGVSILNDCKYGWSAFGNLLRLSLLRSPKAPDDTADMGMHEFSYGMMPHIGSFQKSHTIREAYNFNCPLITKQCNFNDDMKPITFLKLNANSVILESVKKAEDTNYVVLRLYESHGGSEMISLEIFGEILEAKLCNGLEDEITDSDESDIFIKNGTIIMEFKPFQIRSLIVRLKILF